MNQNYSQDGFHEYEPYDGRNTNVDRIFLVQNVLTRTYLYMFAVLVLSGIVAFTTYSSGLWLDILLNNTYFYGLLFGELVVVLFSNYVMRKNLVAVSALMLLIYSVVNGMTLSVIFVAYEAESIVGIFFVAAVMFGALGIFGIITKKDLSTIGKIGYMGVVGAIVFSLANLLIFKSESLNMGIGVAVLALFIGITAYDTQKIKEMAAYSSSENKNTLAMMGALTLYLDFINIFLRLLQLFGKKK